MKKIDLGQTIAIVANLGVIAGIVFLGLELRQNNQLLRADAIMTSIDTRVSRQDIVLSNPSLPDWIAKNRRGEPLSDSEKQVHVSLHSRQLLGWERDYRLFREGIMNEEDLRANLPLMKQAFGVTESTYSMRDHYEQGWKNLASEGYRQFIEACVLNDCEIIIR